MARTPARTPGDCALHGGVISHRTRNHGGQRMRRHSVHKNCVRDPDAHAPKSHITARDNGCRRVYALRARIDDRHVDAIGLSVCKHCSVLSLGRHTTVLRWRSERQYSHIKSAVRRIHGGRERLAAYSNEHAG